MTPKGLPWRKYWRLTTFSRMVAFSFLLRKLAPDIILVQYAQGLWAWMSPVFRGPIVLVAMGGDVLFDEQGQPGLLARAATINLFRASSLAVCKTDYLQKHIKRLRPDTPTQICIWGVDEEIFHPNASAGLRMQMGIDDNALVIFSPRVLQPLYNIDMIIKAFARLASRMGNTHLWISTFRADQEYLAGLRVLVQELHLDNAIQFLAPLSQEEMAAHLAAADIVVSVPASDGLPQTFLESTACGTVTLMSDLPNYARYIQNHRQALLAKPELEDITQGLCALADNPVMRSQLATQAAKLLARLNRQQGPDRLISRLQNIKPRSRWSFSVTALQAALLCTTMLFSGTSPAAKQGQPVCDSVKSWVRQLMRNTGK